MTADNYHSRRHKNFPIRADKGERRERFPLRWPNYIEDDIEQWITYTGCVLPGRPCEICRDPQSCPLFKILMGE
jgi:hypothetical protein